MAKGKWSFPNIHSTVGYHFILFMRFRPFNTILTKYKSNSKIIKQLGKEQRWEGRGEKVFWQLTHYLCRYPLVASSLPSPSLCPSLSVSGRIKSLSPQGLTEIIPVSQGRVEGVQRCHITDVANVKVNLMGLRLSIRGRKRREARGR